MSEVTTFMQIMQKKLWNWKWWQQRNSAYE